MPVTTAYNKTLIISILLLIYLPLLESYIGGGLHWHSPAMMDKISHYLRPVKFTSVLIGFLLLARCGLKGKLPSSIISKIIIGLSYLISAIQLFFLTLGLFFSVLSYSNIDYIHQEKTFEHYTVYVYTADPGAMGKAYHYFNIKCAKPLGIYELKAIKRLNWLGKFDLNIRENTLLITPQKTADDAEKIYTIDLTKVEPC